MNRLLLLVIAASLVAAIGGAVLYTALYSKAPIVSADNAPMHSAKTQPVSFKELVLNDLSDQPRHLGEWKKPILLINFWAPWCAPCRREIPDLIELQRVHAEQLQVIGLSFDSHKNVADFQQQHNINYPLLLVNREASRINRFFGNDSGALPFTAILDAQRAIFYQHHGEISKAELEKQLSLLANRQ